MDAGQVGFCTRTLLMSALVKHVEAWLTFSLSLFLRMLFKESRMAHSHLTGNTWVFCPWLFLNTNKLFWPIYFVPCYVKGIVHPKIENSLLIYSPSCHPVYRWLFFFSRTRKEDFKLKPCCLVIHKIEVNGCCYFVSQKKAYTGNTKLIPMDPCDILRSYEAKRSVCARNWTLFTTLLPVIHSLRQTGKSDSFSLIGSFRQFVSLNWFNSLVNLYNHTIMKHICNYIIKSPNNGVNASKAYKVNKLVFISSPFYIKRKHKNTNLGLLHSSVQFTLEVFTGPKKPEPEETRKICCSEPTRTRYFIEVGPEPVQTREMP